MEIVSDNHKNIISITERIKFKNKTTGQCRHGRYEIDRENGVVFCKICDEQISPFNVLVEFTVQWCALNESIVHAEKRARELSNYKPYLRDMRELEKIWRGKRMLPICPHCRHGIELHDLAKTGCTSRDVK